MLWIYFLRVYMRNFQDYIKYSVRKEAEISDVELLLEFWIIIGWFHCYIVLSIEFSSFYASRDNTHMARRERVMNELLWRLSEHHFSIRSSCTNKRNECELRTQRHFIFFFYSRSLFFLYLTIRWILSIFFSLSCSISILIIYKCVRYMRMFVDSIVIQFAFVLLLIMTCSFLDVIVVEYNNENKKEKKKKERK